VPPSSRRRRSSRKDPCDHNQTPKVPFTNPALLAPFSCAFQQLLSFRQTYVFLLYPNQRDLLSCLVVDLQMERCCKRREGGGNDQQVCMHKAHNSTYFLFPTPKTIVADPVRSCLAWKAAFVPRGVSPADIASFLRSFSILSSSFCLLLVPDPLPWNL
jgi:hypothetical protein